MSYLTDLFDGLRAAIKAAWPDITGIWHAAEIATVPWPQLMEDGELPVAVMISELEPTSRRGLVNLADEGLVTLYYVDRNTAGIEGLAETLQTLRSRLRLVGLGDAGQVVGYPKASWSMDLPANRYFLDNGRPLLAGAVIATITCGTSP